MPLRFIHVDGVTRPVCLEHLEKTNPLWMVSGRRVDPTVAPDGDGGLIVGGMEWWPREALRSAKCYFCAA